MTSLRIAVAMSGGVDSSLAAALLLQAGHQVIGVTLRFAEGGQPSDEVPRCAVDSLSRSQQTAESLAIPHQIVDCAREFEDLVLRPAWQEYAGGRTPSPCLLCNEQIKFGVLLDWAREAGIDALATGHYARLHTDPVTGTVALLRAADVDKDQSYFLAGLSQEQLAWVRFPLGELRKPEVRERARALALPTAEAPESQDACLVGPDQCFAEVLRERFGATSRPGPIVDTAGAIVGSHQGLHRYTVGQRRGLSVRSINRHWVKAIRPDQDALVVTSDERELLGTQLTASGVKWAAPWEGSSSRRCEVQIRYRHLAAPALVERSSPTTVRVIFDSPVRAITPGQAAVFYDGQRVLGRGWIDSF